MSNFHTKIKEEQQQEILLFSENARLDENLPAAILCPPEKLVAVVKPKKVKSPYIETILLFVCAVLSIGADAFIFSTSLFSEIFENLNNNTITTLVALICLLVHIVPEIFWGICIYKKAVRVGNYTVILTSDRIMACGKANDTECKIIKLEDLQDVKQKGDKVTVIAVNQKLKLYLANPDAFIALVQQTYNAL